jgi:uncharacterized membrane protein
MLKQKPHATLVPTMYSKKRLEALSDGIFAIAMTLLVLELKVPTNFAHGQLWQALRLESNDWLAFLITFCIAARYWMLQHNVFMLTENFTHSAVVLTFTFLGLITILPFSSSLMGRYASEPLAFCLYCANQSAIGGVLIAKLEFLRIREHLKKSAEMQHVRSRLYSLTVAMALAGSLAWVIPIRYVWILPVCMLTLGRLLLFRKSQV